MQLMKKGYGPFIAAVSLFCLFLPFGPYCAAGNDSSSKIERLIRIAGEKNLHRDAYWSVMLHYKPAFSGVVSLVDDPKFFLAPDGKRNPQSELHATIRAFYDGAKSGDDHAICRFAGRYAWLKSRLAEDDADFPAMECPDLIIKRDVSLKPRSATMVFPSFFMNNPASMFGHTLLRINSSYESRLLTHAANYAAQMDSKFLYPVKGVFGFYKGYFKVFPYYETIKEYGDLEQRDMWEYDLSLTEEEVQRLFLHLWELKDVYSNYYFFDENCSYHLLFLLDAARPSLRLTDGKGLWVIPVDTLRKIRASGIVAKTNFRPSIAAKIKALSTKLDARALEKAREIARGDSPPAALQDMSQRDKSLTLDLAAELIRYRFYKKKLSVESYKQRYLDVLKERSMLGQIDTKEEIVPPPVSPEEGHSSSRLALGAGVLKGRPFAEVRYRPSYHALTDPDEGFHEGSQIVFADAALRWYAGGGIKLHQLAVIDIQSLAPWDAFFKQPSWKIKTGLYRQMTAGGGEHLTFNVNPGVGAAFRTGILGTSYLLAQANLSAGGVYRDSFAMGAGFHGGILTKITDSWKSHVWADCLFYELGDRFQDYRVGVEQNFRIGRNDSIECGWLWRKSSTTAADELQCRWNHYF